MGFTYPPVIHDSQLYNPLFYASLGSDGLLTYDYAQTLYLGKNDYRLSYISGIVPGTAYSGIALVPGDNNDISGLGAISCSSLTINGTPVSGAPSYVVDITPGTAAINKALVLGASGEIGSISSLTATSITGTLQTAAQPNITSLGTLSSLNATSITGTLQTAAQPNITSLGTLSSLTIGGNLIFTGASRTITGLTSLSASTLTGTIQTAAQPNITSLGTLTGITCSGSISGTLSTAAQPNITSLGMLSSLTAANIISTTAAGTTFTTTSLASEFNCIIRNQSSFSGVQAGISFICDGFGLNITPSVNLYASRTVGTGSYGAADFSISTRTGSSQLSPMAERMRITQAGYIRFGSTSSTAKMDITSSSSLLSGSWQRAMRILNDQTTPIEFEIQVSNTTSPGSEGVAIGTTTSDPLRFMVSNTTKMYLNDSGRLGVNTTSPEATIHAGGECWANNYFHCKGNGDDAARYRFNWSQTDYPAIGTDATIGAVRIGKCNGSYTWTAYVPVRGGSYTNASDERLKTDIIECPYGLDTIMQMRPKKFKMAQEQTTHVGFIAQEVYHIVPEAVDVGANDDMNQDGYPSNPWGIDLASLTSVLCKAIQELKSEVDDLKKIVATLQ